jgi:hypothetical protein|tara:strand:+ start:67 stop:201 length:135 start_codon:yes stop_codon:yes gene_type:complete
MLTDKIKRDFGFSEEVSIKRDAKAQAIGIREALNYVTRAINLKV